jgi:hypothetical protein
VFEGFDVIVFVLFSTFEGNKTQLCGLEKQSSTNTESHSISTFTSYIKKLFSQNNKAKYMFGFIMVVKHP